jgi:hypothetical protein
LTLAAPLAAGVWPRFAGAAPGPDAVRVSIALTEGSLTEGNRTTESPLFVIIENVSTAPQQHFEEWNSWGYGNVEIAWQADDQRTGVARKVPGVFTRNIPTTITLQPGDLFVRQVTFDPDLWQGWPEMPHSTRWELTATYRSIDDRQVGAWSGEVKSPPRSILIR